MLRLDLNPYKSLSNRDGPVVIALIQAASEFINVEDGLNEHMERRSATLRYTSR